MSHTPGPWEQAGSSVYAPGEHGANICTVSEPRASTRVGYTELRIGSPDIKEAYANARLIAAAPDLLRACQRVLGNSEHASWCPATSGDPCSCYYDAALQAVRKALGEKL